MSTGLIDPNEQTTYFLNGRQPGAARQSYVYRANECVSEFNKGKFTQTLKGTLQTYYPDQTFKANQQIALGIQQDTINSLLQGRTNLTGLLGTLAGSLTGPAFLNNNGLVNGIINQALNAGVNVVGQTINGVVNNVLGSNTTRISNVPTAPTSSGLDVGTEEPTLLNRDDEIAGSTTGTEQQMTSSDDAGEPATFLQPLGEE